MNQEKCECGQELPTHMTDIVNNDERWTHVCLCSRSYQVKDMKFVHVGHEPNPFAHEEALGDVKVRAALFMRLTRGLSPNSVANILSRKVHGKDWTGRTRGQLSRTCAELFDNLQDWSRLHQEVKKERARIEQDRVSRANKKRREALREKQVAAGKCCRKMRDQMEPCGAHPDAQACPDKVIMRRANGHFVLPIRDSGSSGIIINHCPWCGSRLPKGGKPE